MGGNQNMAYQASQGGGTRRHRRLANDDAVNDDAVTDDAAGDDIANDDAVGDDYVNDDAYGDDQEYQQQGDDAYNQDITYCPYEEACANYEDLCKNHNYHGADFENFFKCTAFQLDDDQVVYLGPHCGSDGHKISIGFFEDQYCSKYLGNVGSYQELQGYNINDDSMVFYYDSSCISCLDNVRIPSLQSIDYFMGLLIELNLLLSSFSYHRRLVGRLMKLILAKAPMSCARSCMILVPSATSIFPRTWTTR
jgi:hypothetical protein